MTDQTDSGFGMTDIPGAQPGKIALKGTFGRTVEHADDLYFGCLPAGGAGWDKALFLVGDLPELLDTCEYCDTDDDHPAVALVCWRLETEETEPEPFHQEDVLACANAIVPALADAEGEPGYHDAWVEMPTPKEERDA